MGHYTKLRFKAKLHDDTPENIINILDLLINKKDYSQPSEEHQFFKCDRWQQLFVSINWDENLQGGLFYKDRSNRWVIDLETEFKNYDLEIDHFFDWIKPFIVGRKKKQYVGYYRGESMSYQINLYVER